MTGWVQGYAHHASDSSPLSSLIISTNLSSSPSCCAALTHTRPFMPTAISNGNFAPNLLSVGFLGASNLFRGARGQAEFCSTRRCSSQGREGGPRRTLDTDRVRHAGSRTRPRVRQSRTPSASMGRRKKSQVPRTAGSQANGRRRACRPAHARFSPRLSVSRAGRMRCCQSKEEEF